MIDDDGLVSVLEPLDVVGTVSRVDLEKPGGDEMGSAARSAVGDRERFGFVDAEEPVPVPASSRTHVQGINVIVARKKLGIDERRAALGVNDPPSRGAPEFSVVIAQCGADRELGLVAQIELGERGTRNNSEREREEGGDPHRGVVAGEGGQGDKSLSEGARGLSNDQIGTDENGAKVVYVRARGSGHDHVAELLKKRA